MGKITVVFLFSFFVGAALTAQNQSAQTCGNGIVVRAGGNILIDNYTQMIPPSAPTLPPSEINIPNKITLGTTLKDSVQLCFETNDGIKCVTLGEARKIK